MPFRFTLAALLRLRQSVERQRILRLREASLNVARAQESIRQLDQFLAASAAADQAQLRTGRSGAELQFAFLTRENLRHMREQLAVELRQLEQVRQHAAGEYQQAYREREVLETLRDHQRRDYLQERNRRQQRALDVAHLLQRRHNPKG